MYNAKIELSTALSTDLNLIQLIPKSRMFDGIAKFTTSPIYPYLVYYELINTEGQQADDQEIESEITFRIDLYGIISLSNIAQEVDRIMKNTGFTRNYFNDQDEQLDTGSIIKHKIGSYSGNFSI